MTQSIAHQFYTWISVQVILTQEDELPQDNFYLKKSAFHNRYAHIYGNLDLEITEYDLAKSNCDLALLQQNTPQTTARIYLEMSKALLSKGYVTKNTEQKVELYIEAEKTCTLSSELLSDLEMCEQDFRLWEHRICLMLHKTIYISSVDLQIRYLEDTYRTCEGILRLWDHRLSKEFSALFCLRYSEALNLSGRLARSDGVKFFQSAIDIATRGIKACEAEEKNRDLKSHLRFARMQSLFNLAIMQILLFFRERETVNESKKRIEDIKQNLVQAKNENEWLALFMRDPTSPIMHSRELLQKVRKDIDAKIVELSGMEKLIDRPWYLEKPWIARTGSYKPHFN